MMLRTLSVLPPNQLPVVGIVQTRLDRAVAMAILNAQLNAFKKDALKYGTLIHLLGDKEGLNRGKHRRQYRPFEIAMDKMGYSSLTNQCRPDKSRSSAEYSVMLRRVQNELSSLISSGLGPSPDLLR